MLIPKSRWIVKESNESLAKELSNQLNISPLVAKLLVTRGITDAASAQEFLNIENETFHDPYLFLDMKKSVQRINDAIEQQQPILIFGDYDADGVTSTSVIMETLLEKHANVTYYIPNRFTEGYGPNENAFRHAHENGIKLIITVDTGIAGLKEASLAKELGIDLIITDHHEAGDILPDAYAIIHPKLPDGHYPFPHLAGVGVAFKLAHALLGKVPEHLLDLAAIGTIADLVPLQAENRLLVKKGLKKLANTSRPGIQALCNLAGTQLSDINEETVGFAIGPRLNAIGRLQHAGPAVELLMTKDIDYATQLADEIDLLNKERQKIVADITTEAIEMVNEKYPISDNKVLVIGKEGWNPGVIGIVASRLVEHFYRPTIVLNFDQDTGLAKGSARSIEGFDLFKNLSNSRDILPHFGGHTMAAGMTLKLEDVDILRTRLNQAAAEQLTEEDYKPLTELDISLNMTEIDIDAISQINMLAPFGMSNPKPLVMIENVQTTDIRKIGANKTHLKVALEDNNNHVLDGVGFNLGSLADDISPKARLSVIGELSINEWNNRKKPQIFLRDIAINEWQHFDVRGNKQSNDWLEEMKKRNGLFIFFSNEYYQKMIHSDVIDNCVYIKSREEALHINIDGQNIVLFDLPNNINDLEYLIEGKKPARIYSHFAQVEEPFSLTLPTRENFKWYYAFLLKRGSFNVNRYAADLAAHRGWSKETVLFMSKVFFELDFVTINDGIITMNSQKTKKDLADSPTFQRKQAKMQVEEQLLYSSSQELKQWFDKRLGHKVSNEEEMKAWI